VLQRLWYQLPVRWQILLAIATLSIIAALCAGAAAVNDARDRARTEILASIEVAERLASDAVKTIKAVGDLGGKIERIAPLFKHLRHAKISIVDASGNRILLDGRGQDDAAESYVSVGAPSWFYFLVRPEIITRSVKFGNSAEQFATLELTGEPADEIAEVWRDLTRLAVLWAAINTVMLSMLYVILGRILNPLVGLSNGMEALEDGNYGIRLTRPKVREIAVIASQFNHLSEALQASRNENSKLYRELISAQESERRVIANELHDEFGPCLFGLTANAASIVTICRDVTAPQKSKIEDRIGQIAAIADRMRILNRKLLKSLRPMVLGQTTIGDLIGELVDEFRLRHPQISIEYTQEFVSPSYGEDVDIALYRCVQEGLTNAIRHGRADHVLIKLCEWASSRVLQRNADETVLMLTIVDNGHGISKSVAIGFGLATMNERVQGLGGKCLLTNSEPHGVTIAIQIPVKNFTNPDNAAAMMKVRA